MKDKSKLTDKKFSGATESKVSTQRSESITVSSNTNLEISQQTIQGSLFDLAKGRGEFEAQPPTKTNPFKFFDEDDPEAEGGPHALASMDNFTGSVLPLKQGDHIDIKDLSRARYISPNKRKKMSSVAFENRLEEGNLTLLDLLISCKKDITILEYLSDQVRNLFEVTKVFPDGRGFLFYAIRRGFFSVVKKILELAPSCVHQRDSQGKTPLHYAAERGFFMISQYLCVEGEAEVNARDLEGNSPLHFAARNEHQEVLVFLLSFPKVDPRARNRFGESPREVTGRVGEKIFQASLDENKRTEEVSDEVQENFTIRKNLKFDTMFKRRWSLLKNGLISKVTRKILDRGELTEEDKQFGLADICGKKIRTSFPDCYTVRDKGEYIKINLKPEEEQAQEEQKSHAKEQGKSHAKEQESTQATLSKEHRNFTLNDIIGKGSFGEVFLVTQKKEKEEGEEEKQNRPEQYAMKVYNKAKIIRSGLLKFLFLEKRILINFDHPFIVKLYSTFQTARKLYLLMDYCRYKDLGEVLSKEGRIFEYQVRLIAAEILLAIEELHRRNIIHRDIKPDNILIASDGHVLLTDFGLSKDNLPPSAITCTFCGSIAYLPPEIVLKQGHGHPTDWYLLGELVYECLFGMPPFFNQSKKALMEMILNEQVAFPDYANRTTKDFINKLLIKNPSERLGARGGAAEVKAHPFFTGIVWEDVYQKKHRLFDLEELEANKCQDYAQEIVDRGIPSKNPNIRKIANWSISRESKP